MPGLCFNWPSWIIRFHRNWAQTRRHFYASDQFQIGLTLFPSWTLALWAQSMSSNSSHETSELRREKRGPYCSPTHEIPQATTMQADQVSPWPPSNLGSISSQSDSPLGVMRHTAGIQRPNKIGSSKGMHKSWWSRQSILKNNVL